MLEHVYGFPSPPLSPFPFHLNSNEMQNENKWKDSALKMDLSQQPAATSRLNSDPLLHPLVQAWWKSILFFIARNGGWEGWGEIYKKKNVVRKEKGMMEARENEKVMLKNIHLWRLLMKKDRKACHRYAKINWDTIYINWRRGWQK